MADIGFYHLTRTSLLAALPPLLGRTLAAGERALILSAPEQISAIDDALWQSQNPDWLPHGTAATPHADCNDEAQVIAARQRWSEAKISGHKLNYWKQGNAGWEKSS